MRLEKGAFERAYEDVLQNLEFGIVRVYRANPELTDWEALSAIESLLRSYQAEAKGRQVAPPSLSGPAQEVHESVNHICRWRLGRGPLSPSDGGEPEQDSPPPLTLDELIACLKRIRKSINYWTREGGRQGYLTFVDQFIP